MLRVAANNVSVTAQGLTLTEGNAPFGAAISTGAPMGGGSISWSIGVDMTLRDVRVVDNAPTEPLADAAIEFNNGTLTLEDSTIANNSVYGIYGDGFEVYCSGDPKNDAGIWGNYSVNVRMSTIGVDSLMFESDGCDFDGTGAKYTSDYDILLYNSKSKAVYTYGDDADFSCDVSTVTCTK